MPLGCCVGGECGECRGWREKTNVWVSRMGAGKHQARMYGLVVWVLENIKPECMG